MHNINKMTNNILGLIGYPLTHSFSKKYFSEKFIKENISGYEYHNFELQNIEELPDLLQKYPSIIGLNVTIPYKEQVLQYVDKLSEEVKTIGAANTIVIDKNRKITAFNTDIYGFEQSLKPCLKPIHKTALILGTGGAAKAVAYVLDKLNIDFKFVSRNPQTDKQISYRQLDKKKVQNHLLVINTTPLGTFPEVEKSPAFPYHFVTGKHIFYDLIYNPTETVFLKQAASYGATTCNGLKMLHLQAEKSWQRWLQNRDL